MFALDKQCTTAVNDLAGDVYRSAFAKVSETDAVRCGGYYLAHECYKEGEDILNGIEGEGDDIFLRIRQPTDSIVRVRYLANQNGKPKIELLLNGRSGMAVINSGASLVSINGSEELLDKTLINIT